MSLLGALQSSLSGLQAAQAQMQVTSNNIANLNTEGYTRKSAAPQTRVVAGEPAGVQLADLQRVVNDRLLRQLQEHIATLSGQRVESAYLDETQTLFGSLADNSSLSHILTDLGSAIEALAVSPDSLVNRSGVLEPARHLAEQLNFTSESLQQMRAGADQQIATSVDTINALLTDIHDLNQQIIARHAGGDTAPDLEDQRDRLLGKLAEEIDIQYFTRTSGQVVILTGSGRTLLDSFPVTLAHTPVSSASATVTLGNGIGGILLGPAGTDITGEISVGRIGGLVTVRDETLVNLQAETDRLSEALRDNLNALHNNGTAFPPPQTLTGTRSLVATDAPQMTGTFRITAVDATGVVVETLDINLAALAPPNIGQLVTQIDAMANVSAIINAAGQVVISATGATRVSVNELDSSVSTGNATYGMAHFLGLNDLFSVDVGYDAYLSDRVASDTATLGLGGTLTFDVAGAATPVAYAAGDSLTNIATAISAALVGDNITATVVRESIGFRLQIVDGDGDNFYVTDSGTLSGQINLRTGTAGASERIAVRQSLLQDPGLLANAESSDSPTLAVGDIAVSAGDGSIARAMADAFTSDLSFAAAGGLSASATTLANYAAQILAENASNANYMSSRVTTGESFRVALENQIAAISQVNLDEELASIITLQNAYAASARLTTAISEMLDTLIRMV